MPCLAPSCELGLVLFLLPTHSRSLQRDQGAPPIELPCPVFATVAETLLLGSGHLGSPDPDSAQSEQFPAEARRRRDETRCSRAQPLLPEPTSPPRGPHPARTKTPAGSSDPAGAQLSPPQFSSARRAENCAKAGPEGPARVAERGFHPPSSRVRLESPSGQG